MPRTHAEKFWLEREDHGPQPSLIEVGSVVCVGEDPGAERDFPSVSDLSGDRKQTSADKRFSPY